MVAWAYIAAYGKHDQPPLTRMHVMLMFALLPSVVMIKTSVVIIFA